MKKYPLTWMLIITVICIFLGITAWRYTELFYGKSEQLNMIFACFLGGISILWCVIMVISTTKTKLGKKIGKLWKVESKNRNKAFREKVKSGKIIILAVKRRVIANLSFIFSIMFIWVVILLIPNLSQVKLIIYLSLLLAWFAYGFTFSFFFHKRFIIFQNKKFLLNHSEGSMIVGVHEIKNTRIVPNPKYEKSHPSKALSVLMFADIEIELTDGQKLLFKKADKSFNFGYKIKEIQKMNCLIPQDNNPNYETSADKAESSERDLAG